MKSQHSRLACDSTRKHRGRRINKCRLSLRERTFFRGAKDDNRDSYFRADPYPTSAGEQRPIAIGCVGIGLQLMTLGEEQLVQLVIEQHYVAAPAVVNLPQRRLDNFRESQ